jgi:hypothetical protein
MRIKLHNLVEQLIVQNPELANNSKYLLAEVWDRQGLRLYPPQREALLSSEIASAESVARAARKARSKIKAAKEKEIQKLNMPLLPARD